MSAFVRTFKYRIVSYRVVCVCYLEAVAVGHKALLVRLSSTGLIRLYV